MKIAQISLDKMQVRPSKNFLRAIYTSDKIVGGRWLDFLDGTSMRRKSDENTTLEKYLSLNWANRRLRLQIDSPIQDRLIYYAAISSKYEGVTRFAWLDCSLTEGNYSEISLIFNRN